MKRINIKIFVLFLFAILIWAPLLGASPTATDIMTKASAAIKGTKGIKGNFTIVNGKERLSGSIKAAGAKFSIETPSSSSWYNGKQMWTYNALSKETTLFIPTVQEINESNPLEYIKNYASEFTPSFSTTNVKGKYNITLTPKKKRNSVKSVLLQLNSQSLKPENIKIYMKSGASTEIKINNLNYNVSFTGSDFEYSKSKYPKVKIVDLR